MIILLQFNIKMDSLVDHNAHFEQLLNYFASYLKDMTSAVTQIKSLAYMLINVPQPSLKPHLITSDVSSVMAACKRTFDDIKRAESIIRGHVKGKGLDTSPSGSRVQSSSKKNGIPASKFPYIQLQAEPIENYNEFKIQSAKELTEDEDFRCTQYQNQGRGVEETKSTHIINCIRTEPIEKENSDKKVQSVQSYSGSEAASGNFENRIESMRQSSNKQMKLFASQNDECLSLIQKIREELHIKKRR